MTEFILGFHCTSRSATSTNDARGRDEAYLPLLRALAAHPDVKVVLHFSGCLLNGRGQSVEVVDRAGASPRRSRRSCSAVGFYDRCCPSSPERDAIGQIDALRRWIANRFGVRTAAICSPSASGASLAGTLARAGSSTCPVDDTHLLGAGLRASDRREAG
jgi:hypothetical protein